jgi:hypothetical protein
MQEMTIKNDAEIQHRHQEPDVMYRQANGGRRALDEQRIVEGCDEL